MLNNILSEFQTLRSKVIWRHWRFPTFRKDKLKGGADRIPKLIALAVNEGIDLDPTPGRSSSVERSVWDREVGGPIPLAPTEEQSDKEGREEETSLQWFIPLTPTNKIGYNISIRMKANRLSLWLKKQIRQPLLTSNVFRSL